MTRLGFDKYLCWLVPIKYLEFFFFFNKTWYFFNNKFVNNKCTYTNVFDNYKIFVSNETKFFSNVDGFSNHTETV